MSKLYYINDTNKVIIEQYAKKQTIKPDKFYKKDYLVACYNPTGFCDNDIYYVGKREEVISKLMDLFNKEHEDLASIAIISEHDSSKAAFRNARKLASEKGGSKLFCYKKAVKEIKYEERFVRVV